MTELKNRYDFILLFDVKDGNPNGDPDAGNLPRLDPETGHGLVSDVCIKRKIRNFVQLDKNGAQGFDIFVKEKSVLNRAIVAAWDEANKGKDLKSADQKSDAVKSTRDHMCARFFDIRAFGAVLSTGEKEKKGEGDDDKKLRKTAGQVRGPIQVTFGRSIDPIVALEHSITRMAVTSEREAEAQGGDNRTMGRKNTVPYGLYRAHGFVSPQFAAQTKFSEEDLGLLWKSIKHMFEHDRSASRGLMSLRKLIVFKHASELGNAPAHLLFDGVTVERKAAVKVTRQFSDYNVTLAKAPDGVECLDMALV